MEAEAQAAPPSGNQSVRLLQERGSATPPMNVRVAPDPLPPYTHTPAPAGKGHSQ